MKAPTYQQQFNKLTEAYIKGKVFPSMTCACFVGNLLNGEKVWYHVVHNILTKDMLKAFPKYKIGKADIIYNYYSNTEIFLLEACFMNTYDMEVNRRGDKEDAIFKAFEKTLDLLKQIHEIKGETIGIKPIFTKRKLLTHEI